MKKLIYIKKDNTQVNVYDNTNGWLNSKYRKVTVESVNANIIRKNDLEHIGPDNNEIWYTSSDGQVVTPYNFSEFGATIVSNTYSGGKGIIKFNGDVTSIGNAAFNNCTSLTSINIPNSVTNIGDAAFYSCASLTSINIPNSVTNIGNAAFGCCTSLASIDIPNSVTSIGIAAFYSCTSLTSINIPNSVTNIGSQAFCNCFGLTTVTLVNGLTSIGDSAFEYCTSLTSVTVNAVTPPTLGGSSVFDNTNNCPIYVPLQSVNAYKTATNWAEYASRIQAIPPELVDLGLSVKWAKTNVGATTESGYGNLYQWGSTVDNSNTPCDWVHAPFNNGSSSFDQAYFDTVKDTVCPNGVLASQYDVATQTYGTGYRMPTKAEFNELINNTTSSWTTKDGINGRLFTGNNGNSIFIPAAGYRWNSSTRYIGSDAYVWSASLNTVYENYAWYLYFSSDYIYTYFNSRYLGMSVRSVS